MKTNRLLLIIIFLLISQVSLSQVTIHDTLIVSSLDRGNYGITEGEPWVSAFNVRIQPDILQVIDNAVLTPLIFADALDEYGDYLDPASLWMYKVDVIMDPIGMKYGQLCAFIVNSIPTKKAAAKLTKITDEVTICDETLIEIPYDPLSKGNVIFDLNGNRMPFLDDELAIITVTVSGFPERKGVDTLWIYADYRDVHHFKITLEPDSKLKHTEECVVKIEAQNKDFQPEAFPPDSLLHFVLDDSAKKYGSSPFGVGN